MIASMKDSIIACCVFLSMLKEDMYFYLRSKCYNRRGLRGALAQLVERAHGMGEVRSSILLGSTKVCSVRLSQNRLRRFAAADYSSTKYLAQEWQIVFRQSASFYA